MRHPDSLGSEHLRAIRAVLDGVRDIRRRQNDMARLIAGSRRQQAGGA